VPDVEHHTAVRAPRAPDDGQRARQIVDRGVREELEMHQQSAVGRDIAQVGEALGADLAVEVRLAAHFERGHRSRSERGRGIEERFARRPAR